MRWLALALGLLLSWPAAADMYQDGSNAKFPGARENLGITTGCDPVAEFGADPTGAADAAPAINSCLAMTARNGGQMNVRLPVGSFYLQSPINLTKAQVLSGAGRASTILIVYNNFNPSADAIIKLTPGEYFDYGPEVRDLGIYFTQPDAQAGGRAAFQNLGTCTTGAGGTGCKYPPAILVTGARAKIKDIRIVRAWKGISFQSAGMIENAEISALDTGLEVAPTSDLLDWSHYRGLHFWPYEVYAGTNLYSVYSDGGMIAAKFGSANGVNVHDLTSLHGRVIVDGAGFWGYIDGLSLDADKARLEVVRVAQPGLRITNMYTSGDVGGGCKADIGANAQFVQITNAFFQGGPGTQTFICQNGRLLIDNSYFLTGAADQRAVTAYNGYTELRGNTFLAGAAMTVPMVNAANGALIAIGNHFQNEGANVGSIHITSDSPAHYLANNHTRVWPVTFGFSLGNAILGYYDLGDQGFPTTVTPAFETPGNSVLNVTAQGSGFALRGDYVEGALDVTFGSNAYTTASGAFRLKVNGMPPPAPGNASTCSVHLLTFVGMTTVPACTVYATGFEFSKVNNLAAATSLSTTEIPPSWGGMGFRLGWRYRVR